MARAGTALPERLRRLGRTAPLLVQSAVGAGLAYFVASELLGHEQPFFAPVAAIVGLGATYRQRGRRAVEIVIGVAIGVGVGDLVVALVGPQRRRQDRLDVGGVGFWCREAALERSAERTNRH